MIYIKCANYQHFERLINDYISGGWRGCTPDHYRRRFYGWITPKN